jgi:NitT/TauT family transport system substrate-binding protein
MVAAVEGLKRLATALVFFSLAACADRRSTEIRLVLQPPSTNNYPSYFAEWLGLYQEEGVHVTISRIAGASKILEALVGSSADVGGGVYEQTIQMAAEGREVVSFVSLLRSPNFALAVAPGRAIRNVAHLRGKTAGVSSVGSPSQFYLNHLLLGAGVPPAEVSTVGIGMGATAVAAVERGQVDAGTLFGSAITALEARQPNVVILADTRTPEGLKAVFGVDDYPASCLLARAEWLKANPDAARRIAKAVLRSLAWIREHSAEEILARVPAEFRVGDPAAELAAIRLAKPMYSVDGRIKPQSAEAVRRVLAGSLHRVRMAQVDLSRTYTNDFLP